MSRLGRVLLAAAVLAAGLLVDAPEAQANNCYYWSGSRCAHHARLWWGYTNVRVYDNTGSLYPVRTSAANYRDLSARLDTQYMGGGQCAPNQYRCVTFWQTGWAGGTGYARVWWDGAGHIYQAVAWMNLNWSNDPYGARWHAVCQELGHALALEHSGDDDSCMSNPTDGSGEWPNGHDIWMLDNVMLNH